MFDPRVSDDKMRSDIAQGFHDLHLYANDHWLDHLRELVDSSAGSRLGEPNLIALHQALERLTVMHNELAATKRWMIRDENHLSHSPTEDIWHPLQISPAARTLLDRTLVYRKDTSVNDGLTAGSHRKSLTPQHLHSFDTELPHSGLAHPSRSHAILHDSKAVSDCCGRDLGK